MRVWWNLPVWKVVEDRKRRTAARRSQKVKDFRRWARLKETTEEALHCLKNIDPPGEPNKKATRDRWLEVGRKHQSGSEHVGDAWKVDFCMVG